MEQNGTSKLANIHKKILPTDLYTLYYSIGYKNLLKDQTNVPLVIIL